MKNIILLVAIFIVAIAFMAFDALNHSSILGGGGANPGYSGDPAGGNRTCIACHDGPDATSISGLITSNIPAAGYFPDSTYTITAAIKSSGHSEFGFQVSPQTSNGTFIGTLVNTDSRTQLTGSGNNYITNTSEGTSGTDSIAWTFDWIAPAQGSGNAIMYGAFLVANANKNTKGDTTYISTLEIPEYTSVYVANISLGGQNISIYPNPAVDQITVETGDNLLGLDYMIIDQIGRQVLKGQLIDETTSIGSLYVQITLVSLCPSISSSNIRLDVHPLHLSNTISLSS